MEVVELDGRGTRLPLDPDRLLVPDFVLPDERPGIGGRPGVGGRFVLLLVGFPLGLFPLAVLGPAAFLRTRNLGSKVTSPLSFPFSRVTTVSSMKFRDCLTSLILNPISVASALGIRTRVRSLIFMTSTSVLPTYLLTATKIQSGSSSGPLSTGSTLGGSVIAELR